MPGFEMSSNLAILNGEELLRATNLDHAVRLARYIFSAPMARDFDQVKDKQERQLLTNTPWTAGDSTFFGQPARLQAHEPLVSPLGRLVLLLRKTPPTTYLIQHEFHFPGHFDEKPKLLDGAHLNPRASAISPDKPLDMARDYDIIKQIYGIAEGLGITVPSLWQEYSNNEILRS
jgi:hypothetical protein